jgi:AmiR/NasT family two-component response regulator
MPTQQIYLSVKNYEKLRKEAMETRKPISRIVSEALQNYFEEKEHD